MTDRSRSTFTVFDLFRFVPHFWGTFYAHCQHKNVGMPKGHALADRYMWIQTSLFVQ